MAQTLATSLSIAPFFQRLGKTAQRELVQAMLRTENLPSARILWDQVLTHSQQQQLRGTLEGVRTKQITTVGMWLALNPGLQQGRAIIQVAKRIGHIDERIHDFLDRAITEADPASTPRQRAHPRRNDPDERIDKAARRYDLVLVRSDSETRVYWNTRFVAMDLPPVLWELLWQLAFKAQTNQSVGFDDVKRGKTDRAILHRRARLGGKLPEELDAKILNKPGKRYKLELPPTKVKLIDLEPGEWLSPIDVLPLNG